MNSGSQREILVEMRKLFLRNLGVGLLLAFLFPSIFRIASAASLQSVGGSRIQSAARPGQGSNIGYQKPEIALGPQSANPSGGTSSSNPAPIPEPYPPPEKFIQEGISVEFSIRSLTRRADKDSGVREGEDAEVQFTIKDSTSGNPVRGLHPAAWMETRPTAKASDSKDCHAKVQSFLSPSLNVRPEVDLNVYFVLSLNEDASISVVDPLFGYGGSKLLTTVQLKSPGQDWVLTGDRKKLYVSMPSVNQIAVIDTATWRSVLEVEAGPNPLRLSLQPDEKYLWVGNDAEGIDAQGGVTVIDTSQDKVIARIPTGPGHHEIAFSTDGGYAFVTNKRKEGTVSIIDTRQLQKVSSIEVGGFPVSIAFSKLSRAAYVANEEDGTITVIDGQNHRIRSMIRTKPGVKVIRFADNGRWGFVLNEKESMVHILDSSTDRIMHSVEVGSSPEQVSFSKAYAYIRSRGTEQVTMIQLGSLGRRESLPVTQIPGGETSPEKGSSPASADAIVATPEGNSVLIANAADKTIYYYEEGMAAPMGSFRNYGRFPRAVLVVDRSLREVGLGVYSTNVMLSRAGTYDVAFLLDSPRLVHCFDMVVKPNQALKRKQQVPLQIDPLLKEKRISIGETVRIKFRAIDPNTQQPRTGLKDLGVLILLAPGTWQRRELARPLSEDVYEVTFIAPQAGVYYVFFECPSLDVHYQELPQLILHAMQEKTQPPATAPNK
jgi:YVTN family beta-propeller protein